MCIFKFLLKFEAIKLGQGYNVISQQTKKERNKKKIKIQKKEKVEEKNNTR